MGKKDVIAKVLAIFGTLLVWLPLVAPVFFGIVSLIGEGRFRFDFLMPAELFPVILLGAALLLVAAFLARSQLKWIGWSLVSVFGFILLGQGLAMVTGLASGANEASGWRLTLLIGAIVLFFAALISVGVGGILLIRNLFRKS